MALLIEILVQVPSYNVMAVELGPGRSRRLLCQSRGNPPWYDDDFRPVIVNGLDLV
jgi:hypothetical protein